MITPELTGIYIPIAITALYLWAIYLLWTLDTKESYKSMASLTALWCLGWLGDIFSDISLLMRYEAVIFVFMWLFLRTFWGVMTSILTILMIVNNAIFLIKGGWPIHRMSIVSIIFIIQCVIWIVVVYYTRYERGKDNTSGGDPWYAMQGLFVGIQKLVRRY